MNLQLRFEEMHRTTMTSHCFISVSCALLFFLSLSSSVAASISQTFQHANLLRTIDLTKPYIRDSTALILENIGNLPQTEYFWGVPLELAPKLSYLEVKEKKAGSIDLFPIERAQEDHEYLPVSYNARRLIQRLLQIYKITIPELSPGEKISLMISSAYVDCLTPYPAILNQDAKQYAIYSGEKYTPTLYTTLKQKTKIK
jgi:oligosaccharyltransferase complex subunit alpha (ribophorin I)